MPTYIRNNAWNSGGTFENTDLLWYAKAVAVMQAKPIAKPTSWWFYAAIHGELLLPESVYAPPQQGKTDLRYYNWKNVKYIPAVAALNDVPPTTVTDGLWDQCQHATWFFPPWHRGYLLAIENILRAIIVGMGGPAEWALPYWNYLSQANKGEQATIPPAFTVQQLPDGSRNPLFVAERYPEKLKLGTGKHEINDQCQWDTIYTEGSTVRPRGPHDIAGYYYGGGDDGFRYQDGSETGDLEDNPHNSIHDHVGGRDKKNGQGGLIGNPPTAALDPIFYLHHANIDRMWAAWNETSKNANPADARWLVGPVANGNSRFVMPLDDQGKLWYFSPKDMQNSENVRYNGMAYSYTYDDLALTSLINTPPAPLRSNLLQRFAMLNITGDVKNIKMAKTTKSELIGASTETLRLTSEITTSLKLQKKAWKKVSDSLLTTSFANIPDQVFLQLEGVKGTAIANSLAVYINDEFARSVSLFGLINATIGGGPHRGRGLTFKINITNIIDNLHLNASLAIDSLNIRIETKHEVFNGDEITIDRIGVYRIIQ